MYEISSSLHAIAFLIGGEWSVHERVESLCKIYKFLLRICRPALRSDCYFKYINERWFRGGTGDGDGGGSGDGGGDINLINTRFSVLFRTSFNLMSSIQHNFFRIYCLKQMNACVRVSYWRCFDCGQLSRIIFFTFFFLFSFLLFIFIFCRMRSWHNREKRRKKKHRVYTRKGQGAVEGH